MQQEAAMPAQGTRSKKGVVETKGKSRERRRMKVKRRKRNRGKNFKKRN